MSKSVTHICSHFVAHISDLSIIGDIRQNGLEQVIVHIASYVNLAYHLHSTNFYASAFSINNILSMPGISIIKYDVHLLALNDISEDWKIVANHI